MPDGEVYTAPVEDSAQGWVYFDVPSVLHGNEVQGIRLEFEAGKVVAATADKNQAFLDNVLDTDVGARYIGEFAFGLNQGIQRPVRNILFDEKIGGTFHIALGGGYPESGSQNQSAIHWDMICDMRTGGEIAFDGEVVFRDGDFIL
jgi:aminopeptidase